MAITPVCHPFRHRQWLARLGLLSILALLVVAAHSKAQTDGRAPTVFAEGEPLDQPKRAVLQPPCELSITGFPPALPPLAEKPPHTAAEVASLVENVGNNDAMFEVILGEGRLLTLKEDLAIAKKPKPLIAVGDPTVIDYTIVGPRQLRIHGFRLGSTDLSITTADGQVFSFEVQVVVDLRILRAQLRAVYPDASLKIAQIRDHLVVEGEARDIREVAHIIETIRAYLLSIQAEELSKISGQSTAPVGPPTSPSGAPLPRPTGPAGAPEPIGPPVPAGPGVPAGPRPSPAEVYAERAQYTATGTVAEPRIINLIRVPGSHQVLLKVRVAELNRTALREIGADVLGVDPATGAILGTQIGGAGVAATGTIAGRALTGTATDSISSGTTIFGIFEAGHFEFLLSALRRNSILKILAEPNLVTMSGQQASFLAGGEFPVPVPQSGGAGGAPVVTVAFREFGVRLGFVPYVLDNEVIRLTVDPEVSNVDFSVGTVLVPGGSPVPGLNTRKTHTTVELRQGQTLAIAGLLQLTMDGTTSRIPGLGDLPILGPFFSNTLNRRTEKELMVLVTPYLVEPMNACQVPPLPGEEFKEPNDLETFFFNRIEGRTGTEFRSTVAGEDPLRAKKLQRLEKDHVQGPCGFSE